MPNNTNNSDEIEVESLHTSAGNVPTVKGLEKVVNVLYDDMKPLAKAIENVDQNIAKITDNMKRITDSLENVAESVADFIMIVSKLNLNIEKFQSQFTDDNTDNQHKSDLIEIQKTLSTIIREFVDKTSSSLVEKRE